MSSTDEEGLKKWPTRTLLFRFFTHWHHCHWAHFRPSQPSKPCLVALGTPQKNLYCNPTPSVSLRDFFLCWCRSLIWSESYGCAQISAPRSTCARLVRKRCSWSKMHLMLLSRKHPRYITIKNLFMICQIVFIFAPAHQISSHCDRYCCYTSAGWTWLKPLCRLSPLQKIMTWFTTRAPGGVR